MAFSGPVGTGLASEDLRVHQWVAGLAGVLLWGEETDAQLCSHNHQHLPLLPLTFSLDARPATCLVLAGAAEASDSAARCRTSALA